MVENPLDENYGPNECQAEYDCGKDAGLNGEDIPSYNPDFDYLDYCYLLGWFDGMMERQRTEVIDEAIDYFMENAHEVYNHVSARDFICDSLEQLKNK